MWKRSAPRLGWIRSELTMYLVEVFGALVEANDDEILAKAGSGN